MNQLFPTQTTVGNAGLFADPSTYGLVQGMSEPDPAYYFWLRGGILNAAETLPMWGGVAIFENVPGPSGSTQPSQTQGPQVGRATTVTGGSKPLAGWAVYDQAYAWVTSPVSQAGQAGLGQTIPYYPLGSRARVPVACDAALAAELQAGPSNAPIAWDFVNQLLVPYTGALAITSGTYVSGTGIITLTMPSNPGISPGDSVTLSALTGTGAFAALDGTWPAITGTTGTTVVLQGPIGAGAATITGGGFTTGAELPLNLRVLSVQTSNCMTVSYNAGNGFTNWNFGPGNACALIQI
jgi:hypothetical protein